MTEDEGNAFAVGHSSLVAAHSSFVAGAWRAHRGVL
jgi:hypothetical protein